MGARGPWGRGEVVVAPREDLQNRRSIGVQDGSVE